MQYRPSWLDVRGLRCRVHTWGDADKPLLVMLHGWMDCGASYKFIAPKLADNFFLVAPDLRGFGETDHVPGGYYFPEYFADLEVILNHYSPQAPVNLLGHSMGGNIAMMYAGIRPDRVSRLMSLEALGLPESAPADAVGKYRDWMREILSGEPSKVYPDLGFLKQSIYKGNPTLSDAMIDELANLWGKPVGEDGAWMLKHDHAHRYTNPVRYQRDDAYAVWGEITARVGLLMAADSWLYKRFLSEGVVAEICALLGVAEADNFLLEDCNHMLHLEQPEQTARCIEAFFN